MSSSTDPTDATELSDDAPTSDSAPTPDSAKPSNAPEPAATPQPKNVSSPDRAVETDVLPVEESSFEPEGEPATGDSATGNPLASDLTIAAPSYRSPSPPRSRDQGRPELNLRAGQTIDDFQIIELIGRGAFGGVYLARQQTLDRLVALKITSNRGSEGRTLAQLEHDYIVRVFSETVDSTGEFRLLCMQLVPGSSLEEVIQRLRTISRSRHDRGEANTPYEWTGRDYLKAIVPSAADASRSRVHDVFDPTALRDRELIGGGDDVQTTAWVGARLAEAVDYAHRRQVLHRDIKPANVLVNRHGRPLLADFNIAQRTLDDGEADGAFGGTIAFMAPEHLDAFNPRRTAAAEPVDERSDLYSLGIVIHELLTGRPPFDNPARDAGRVTFVGALADARRAARPPISDGLSDARKVLERTIAKSLEPQKENRYASGRDFAAALEGAAALRTAEHEFPLPQWLTRAMQNNALLWLIVLVVVPQILSSVVNIAYNLVEIATPLGEERFNLFFWGVMPVYNLIAYPLLLGLGALAVVPVFRVWREVHGAAPIDPARVDEARRRALRLPVWLLLLVAAGWLPGGLIFPLIIDYLQGPLDWKVYLHFAMSFTLSGLIAAAYSFAGLQYLVLRVMYPRLWADATSFRQIARSELAHSQWRVRIIPTLSYAIPVVAVLSIIAAASIDSLFSESHRVELSQLLLCGLLNLLGLLGVVVVGMAARRMARTLVAITGRQV